MKRKNPIIMVASTVYGGFDRDIEQICATLRGLGYEVWNSHLGTIPVYSTLSALDS